MNDSNENPTSDGAQKWRVVALLLFVIALIVGPSIWWLRPQPEKKSVKKEPPKVIDAKSAENQVSSLVDSEEWILRTTPELPKLASGVLNMQLPDVRGLALFGDEVKVEGLQTDGEPDDLVPLERLQVSSKEWPVSHESTTMASDEIRLWEPLFDHSAYFERAKFYIVRAHFVDETRDAIEADLNFDGVAREKSGQLVHVKAKQKVTWKSDSTKGKDAWRIAVWKQKSLTTTHRSEPLFRDVLTQAIPDKQQLARAQESKHEQLLIDLVKGTKAKPPHEYFSPHAADRHPSVSVVDIDRDGFDDLYVMPRLGRNMLFRNRGDGTFEDIAPNIGLDIENHCASAIFADYDNDGDDDLFLGRTLERSMYFENDNGRFVDRSESHVAVEMPFLVFTISVVDYNGDGLLDVFMGTYSQETQVMSKPDFETKQWLAEFLSEEDARELYRRRVQHNTFDKPGPPNVLLVNRGTGKFELAPENDQLALWRQTTQATWADFDDDGDPDVYISNDLAINNMFRNDGPKGFVDITEQTGTADVGFGMGVSWGDYDLDGKQDLYVSNMFSKAGRRITAQLDSIDPRFAQMARGNSLFRNLGDRFEKVSGLTPPALMVEKAGWAWGGQFVDIDNDGYLDIHAVSGFTLRRKDSLSPPTTEAPIGARSCVPTSKWLTNCATLKLGKTLDTIPICVKTPFSRHLRVVRFATRARVRPHWPPAFGVHSVATNGTNCSSITVPNSLKMCRRSRQWIARSTDVFLSCGILIVTDGRTSQPSMRRLHC